MLKKRFFICLALLAALLMANTVMIQAANISVMTPMLNSTGDGYIVSDCRTDATGSLTIPEKHINLPVVEIGREAFLGCTQLTSVTIPSSVKTIGWYAFSGCTGLTSITIPDSVTTLDWFAFSDCTGLTSVTIGNGVTCIDAASFAGCTNLTTVTVGTGVTSIGWSAFKDCAKLSTINIPHSVTSIERYAFYNCDALSSVTYCGTRSEWLAIEKGEGNTSLDNITLTLHNFDNRTCTLCGATSNIPGDIDGNESVDSNDAIYLLLHTLFPSSYPLGTPSGDVDGDGTTDLDDAVYLLLHTMFGAEMYPLKT